MVERPTYEQLELQVKTLRNELAEQKREKGNLYPDLCH